MSSTPDDQRPSPSWTDESLPMLVRRQLLAEEILRVRDRSVKAASARAQARPEPPRTDEFRPGS